MKKVLKLLSVILAFTVLLGSFAACKTTPDNETHTCQSVCQTCGKCTDKNCLDAACSNKCQGHSQTPTAHECESVCPDCGKCLDAACTDSACSNKCQGHTQTPPAHECESACSTCGKCTDLECLEVACSNKCLGHKEDIGEVESGNVTVKTETTDLALMTFNIRQTDKWASRKEAFMLYLNQSDATVVCMQEVKLAQVEDIKNGLKERFEVVYYGRESGSNPEGLAVVYDKHVWNKIEQSVFWLSETPEVMSKGWGASYYRICVNVLLQHKQTGAKLNVFNVHLDHQVEDARVNGMNLVLERVALSRYPSFVTGDMNCTIETPAIKAAASAMIDCQAKSPITEGGNTYNGWNTTVNPETLAIDFCFVSKYDFEPLKFDICREKYTVTADGITFSEDTGSLLSDHYAVKATVRLTYKTTVTNPEISQDGFYGDLDRV